MNLASERLWLKDYWCVFLMKTTWVRSSFLMKDLFTRLIVLILQK